MVPLSLCRAQLQLQGLNLLPRVILEEVRGAESPHGATAGRRQRATNTEAEIAQVGEGSWTELVDVIVILLPPHGSEPTPPQGLPPILALALCSSSSPAAGQDFRVHWAHITRSFWECSRCCHRSRRAAATLSTVSSVGTSLA